jgi:ABC-type sugar transport system ATPase subunit
MAKVILENLVKSYPGEKGRPGKTAVDQVSFEIEDREFLVLVGPSGCGKTTTLRMIAGLEEISSGSIYIDGRKVNDVAPKDRDIAMVFQNYALYPTTCSTANPRPCREDNASGWPWAAPSFGSPRPFCSTSRSPTWMPKCAWK